MNFVLWEQRDDDPVEKGSDTIARREGAKRIVEAVERRAQELHGPPIEAALRALWEHAPDPAKSYEAAKTYLAEHEGQKMKMKPTTPTADAITKSFGGPDGAEEWRAYCARAARDQRDDMDAIYKAFTLALAPVVALLKSGDGFSEAQAIDRAFACTPTAYAALRAAQNLRHANASRATDETIQKRVSTVAGIAKALVGAVAKSGAGTVEARLLATAAAHTWED
jgi:hypothetical protein